MPCLVASKPCGHGTKLIKIPDPLKFHRKPAIDSILYKDWLLQIWNKLRANEAYMPNKFLKISYIVSLVADNALAQLRARLKDKATQLFTTAKKLLEVLTVAFENVNCKQEARLEYQSLCQGTGDFRSFWAEFQRLASELDHSKATLIEDLIKKSHHSI